ncbi:hypothetical protein LTR29_007986 [Friedmanniomyces endolithicus]|nr:hypothetical protein LTS09_005740 [Friedmanniomyces endolithicus]KAK0940398.1 hypothetical protein LTR29_007986 [Friedmanniomyces endolithicus]KAK1808794.1 hypothetical protein LTR12_016853 [Friedmanniomyces endolithicus]
MGKRKKSSRKPMGPKKVSLTTPAAFVARSDTPQRDPLATSFKCPFCDHDTSVTVSIDRKTCIGTLDCRNCGQHYQSSSDMRSLMQAVDVYYEWIDACEIVNEPRTISSGATTDRPSATLAIKNVPAASRAGLAPGEKFTEEDRGFIDDADDMDAEAEYDDE